MIHWVYIKESKEYVLTIGLCSNIDGKVISLDRDERLVYLRPFRVVFDAAAHKHLLDVLSTETIRGIIEGQRETTQLMLRTMKARTTY